MDNKNFDEEEKYGEKEKAIANIISITILSLIGIAVIVFLTLKYLSKEISEISYETKYYYLEVTDKNREEIISRIEQENQEYCDSMYKIEFHNSFPDSTDYTIYCGDEENITFSIDGSAIATYILEHGRTELR